MMKTTLRLILSFALAGGLAACSDDDGETPTDTGVADAGTGDATGGDDATGGSDAATGEDAATGDDATGGDDATAGEDATTGTPATMECILDLEDTCTDCLASECADATTAAFGAPGLPDTAGGACEAFFACAFDCTCEDDACLDACSAEVDETCQAAFEDVAACIESDACIGPCTGAECGNGVVDANEPCDGDESLDGATCADAGFANDALLSCSDSCELVIDACDLGETRDGATCDAPLVVADVGTIGDGGVVTIEENNSDAQANHDGSCSDLLPGRELVFSYTPGVSGSYTISMAAGADDEDTDALLYVRSACDDADSELACNDDEESGETLNSEVSVELTADTTYFIMADTYSAGDGGEFTLTITPPAE